MPGWEGCEAWLSQRGKTLPPGGLLDNHHPSINVHHKQDDQDDNVEQDDDVSVEDDCAQFLNS